MNATLYTAATNFAGLVNNLIGELRPLAALFVGLALAYFIYGVAVFILNSVDATKREEGKKHMLWGIIALFVMVSLWGLANLISGSLDLDDNKVDNRGFVQPR